MELSKEVAPESDSSSEKVRRPSLPCSFVDTQEVKDLAANSLSLTSQIIDQHGPRICGSESCHKAAEDLYAELKKSCDAAEKEKFNVKPDAFFGFIKVGIVCFLCTTLCVAANLLFIGFCFSTFALLSLIMEYLFYFHFLDPFYPSADGFNVYGIIEPEEEVKYNIVFSGHHDSTKIFNFYYDNPELYMVREVRAFVLEIIEFIIMTTIIVWKWRAGIEFELSFTTSRRLILSLVLFLLFFWVKPLWYFLNEKGTPGAGDNLVSSTNCVIMSRYFKDRKINGHSLKHTKLFFASFDGEECGLRGANAFWQRHKEEFTRIPTYNINSDCPYYHDELRFLTKDINWTVKLSDELANDLASIAHEQGFNATPVPIRFLCGATDAGEAAFIGVKATTLLSIPFTNVDRPTVYHTPDDVVESVEPRAIEQALAVMITYAEKLDNRAFTKLK